MKLGINIDHIATLRQTRGTHYPEPLVGAHLALDGGADFITVHLREDRRHIQEEDVEALLAELPVKLNLELAITTEMVDYACRVKPDECCLVPEKREELTTEGGLDVVGQQIGVTEAVKRLTAAGITVSLFIDPSPDQVAAAGQTGATVVELHTGQYALLAEQHGFDGELSVATVAERERLFAAATQAAELGLKVNAGHGLHRQNLQPLLSMPALDELNIGHAVISRAVFIGLPAAVAELRQLIDKPANG
ncbi:MAG: pyridoxine 5'-phosphate synthase [Immundisolibacteraceae bacterium]|nr:pyridoxine 5'-phosphate synthase [Immundisolibacteraceae bacterium]